MEMTNDRPGMSESGVTIPVGTVCVYEGHVPGGMVRVRLPSGAVETVHPSIFGRLRYLQATPTFLETRNSSR